MKVRQALLDRADAIIIGGGCMGSSIAYHLTTQGFGNVVLVEKSHLASGATGRSAGIVRQHYSTELLARMALRCLRFFQNFEQRVGGQCGFTRTGFLVGVSSKATHALEQVVALQRGVGINTRIITPNEAKELVPALETTDLGALAFEPDSGYADPAQTTLSFAAAAREQGCRIEQGVEALKIQVEDGEVKGLLTNKGEIVASTLVLATGPWSNRLLNTVGLTLPITPSRQQICAFKRPPDFAGAHPVYADFINMIYARPETGNITLVGSIDPSFEGTQADPDHYKETVDDEFLVTLAEKIMHRLPPLSRGTNRGGWAGIYDVTPDWHPILDAAPSFKGLYFAAGFSGHGFKLSPEVGRMLAELVSKGAGATPEVRAFRLSRFHEGELITPKYSYGVIG